MTDIEPESEVPADAVSPLEDRDAFELLPDGRARFVIEGRTHTLRRPRLGEYKVLRNMVIELGNAVKADANTDQLEYVIKWVAETFSMLSDRPLPDSPDDWPTWVASGGFQVPLLNHWRAVPLAPGQTGVTTG